MSNLGDGLSKVPFYYRSNIEEALVKYPIKVNDKANMPGTTRTMVQSEAEPQTPGFVMLF